MMSTIKRFSGKAEKKGTPLYDGDDWRWKAILSRDRNADGKFFYSVRTTGIYCRPSCGARPARRKNVEFHETFHAAEQAGFRACKKCQPNGRAVAEEYAAKVAAACRAIKAADEAPSLAALAKSAGMSRFHFHRVFTRIAGLTPKAYATAHRAEQIRNGLMRSTTVTQAIYDAGFNSNSRFYANASHILGMSPKRYRQGGKETIIRFAVRESSLGPMLVATSAKGICAIFMGNDPDELIKDLQKRFSEAELIGRDKQFERVVGQVIELIDTPRSQFDLPLDIRGTVFQQKVWAALRKIPVGATASYGEIAKRIGRPRAIRAVAAACAANPVAVAIPCHRVVRRSGALSGYRWGVERKRALLNREKSARDQERI
jgi:AraC family transcriptional regulator of adaptative response/methylated-DNA-[protein]-cysteine methyltransferase